MREEKRAELGTARPAAAILNEAQSGEGAPQAALPGSVGSAGAAMEPDRAGDGLAGSAKTRLRQDLGFRLEAGRRRRAAARRTVDLIDWKSKSRWRQLDERESCSSPAPLPHRARAIGIARRSASCRIICAAPASRTACWSSCFAGRSAIRRSVGGRRGSCSRR